MITLAIECKPVYEGRSFLANFCWLTLGTGKTTLLRLTAQPDG